MNQKESKTVTQIYSAYSYSRKKMENVTCKDLVS